MEKLRKPRTHCRGILPEFVDKILSGEKTTTIRPNAKNMQVGDKIKFYTGWRKKGAFYQLTVDIVKNPEEFIIGDYVYFNSDKKLETQTLMFTGFGSAMMVREEIAQKDGFVSFDDMVDFFRRIYPAKKNMSWSFEGVLISFANPRVERKKILWSFHPGLFIKSAIEDNGFTLEELVRRMQGAPRILAAGLTEKDLIEKLNSVIAEKELLSEDIIDGLNHAFKDSESCWR